MSTRTSGFTIAEVVVVIGIIGVLSAIVYTSLSGQQSSARDKQRVSDLSNISLALEQYFNTNGQYPATLDALVPSYLPATPTPPTTPGTSGYGYYYFPLASSITPSACVNYQLWTTFEKTEPYLANKKGYDSTQGTLPNSMVVCGSGTSVNASSSALVFDMMAQ